MALANTTIKRHNHKLHICQTDKKQALLSHILDLYKDKSVLLVSETNTTTTELKDKNLTLTNDAELAKMGERTWDVVINFEAPSNPEAYLNRMYHSTQFVHLLAFESEEAGLYDLEILLGRSILRENIEPFAPLAPVVAPSKPKPMRMEHEKSPFGAAKPSYTPSTKKNQRIVKMPAPK